MTFQKNAGAVRRFNRIMKFGAWLMDLPSRLIPPPFRLMQISSAFWQSRALYLAARLNLATHLGDGKMAIAELAARAGVQADALGRLLRLLAAMGIFSEPSPGVWRNNRLSNHLRPVHPQGVRAMIVMHNAPFMSRPWYEQLENGVRNGTPPFELAYGEELYDYLDRHPEDDRLFSEAMDCVAALTGDGFARDFDWGRFARIIDVGGSRGSKSLAILKRHPQLTALVVDRPPVVAEAQSFWAAHPAEACDRLSFLAGDLFGELPAAGGEGDIYLLSAVFHAFDDDATVRALRNLALAVGGSGARIALLELVLPETGADIASASFDMQMFMGTRGRERTLSEWNRLVGDAGLRLEEVVGLQGFGNILVLQVAG
ncbi:MAG: methyltransferase [Actinomycetota bacterium]